MVFCALSAKPNTKQLQNVDDEIKAEPVKQVWFADDSSAAETLKGILQWWKKLTKIGQKYGYNPNPTKRVTHNWKPKHVSQFRHFSYWFKPSP